MTSTEFALTAVSSQRGVRTVRVRLIAVAVSGALTAMVGTFHAMYLTFIEPAAMFSLTLSIQIAMFAIMAVAGYLLFNAADTAFEHYALSLIEGTAGGFAYVNGYSLAQRSVKASQVARVSGFYYAAATLPAAISGYVMAKLVEWFGWSLGSTLMMTVLMAVPIVISLFIDTTKVTGRGRRRTPGARLWT